MDKHRASSQDTINIQQVTADTCGSLITDEDRLVLLLCMPRDEEFAGQMRIMESVALRFKGSVKAACMNEDALVSFKNHFSIRGTPTYLLLRKGREVNRFIGLATEDSLVRLIESHSD